MQITVPNEFQPIGKYNIGCTAGIESNIAPGDWIEGCNRMNLILGSSKHTIDVLKNSKWRNEINKLTNLKEYLNGMERMKSYLRVQIQMYINQ
jgi:hypothetical protein